MKEFLGFGGYTRPAEGFMSWQHLTFVTSLVVIMIALAFFLGKRNKTRSEREKNFVLIISAILIDAVEIFKIVVICMRSEDGDAWTRLLPLFLCSIQLITIPLAAFTKGRIKEASLDFVLMFGILGALLGTYGAAQNYGCYPVMSIDNVASGITHTISGFASLYIAFSGMTSMKKKNIPISLGILSGVCITAYVVNILVDYNYMFLMRGDGTPYDIFYNLVGGNPVLYPIVVVGLFFIYITVFYWIYFKVTKKDLAEEEKTLQAV